MKDKRTDIQFTDTEKEVCLPLVQKMIGYSILSRRKGILAFEKELENVQDSFLKTALQMAADAVDPRVIENVLNETIKSANPQGADLLGKLIIIRCIISIVEGDNPHLIAENITAILGDKYTARIKTFIPDETEKTNTAKPIETTTIQLIAKTLSEKHPNADLGELNNDYKKLLGMIEKAGLTALLPKVSPEKMEDILLDIMLTWATEFYPNEEGPLLDTEVEHYG